MATLQIEEPGEPWCRKWRLGKIEDTVSRFSFQFLRKFFSVEVFEMKLFFQDLRRDSCRAAFHRCSFSGIIQL